MKISTAKLFLQFFTAYCVLLNTVSSSLVSECDRFGICSQKCDVIDGLARCSCLKGFILTGNETCAPTDPDWKLIYATGSNIVSVYSSGKLLKSLTTYSEGHPRFVTSDIRKNVVYWTDATNQRQTVYKSNMNHGSIPDVVVNVGTSSPTGIAFDWITGNVYFVDSNLTYIAVCAQNPIRCSVVSRETSGRLGDIALHPNMGIMFWTKLGNDPCIMKARMDGSSPTAVVSQSVNRPTGITIDEPNSRIYWVDDIKAGSIESSLFDGRDRRHITTSEHPYGINIFGDIILWSEPTGNTIMSANKFTGENKTTFKSSRGPLGLNVMNLAKQPILRDNPCEQLKCSHICALSGPSAKCLCQDGMLANGTLCVDNEQDRKLLVAHNGTLHFMKVHTVGKDVFKRLPLPPQIKSINALIYNPINDTLIISDVESRRIVEYSLKTNEYSILVEKGIVNVTSLAIDVVGENLVWLDAGKRTIEVMSLETRAKTVVRKNVENAHDIVFVPEYGALYYWEAGKTGGVGEVRKIFLGRKSDGSFLFTQTEPGVQAHMAYNEDTATERVVLASGNGTHVTIETVSPDQLELNKLTLSGYPVLSVLSIGSKIYWVDKTNYLKVITKDADGQTSLNTIRTQFRKTNSNSTSNRMVLASINNDTRHLDKLRLEHNCSPNNPNRTKCSHVCLPVGINMLGECWCSDGFHLSNDNLTCTKDKNCKVDKELCASCQFLILTIFIALVGGTILCFVKLWGEKSSQPIPLTTKPYVLK